MLKLPLDELNSWVFYRNVKKYQYLILKNIEFSIVFKQESFNFIGSEIDENASKNILNFGNRYSHIKLESNAVNTGYELNCNINIIGEPYLDRPQRGAAICIIGERNFAHFIWNQLPAFNALYSESKFPYHQTIDTIGKVEDILSINNFDVANNLSLNVNKVLIGGEYLDKITWEKLSSYVKKYNNKGLVNQFLHLLDDNKDEKYVYMGIRGPGIRALNNEVDFYFNLCKELKLIYSNINIILDGFSYQNHNKNVSFFSDRCKLVSLRIDELVDKLKNIGIGVTNINGLPLLRALDEISKVNFYVTHEGTMHHKIGWIYRDKPGCIIVGNEYDVSTALWHSNQVEGSKTPHVIPFKYLRKVDPFIEKYNRDSEFFIFDIKSAINFLIDCINLELK